MADKKKPGRPVLTLKPKRGQSPAAGALAPPKPHGVCPLCGMVYRPSHIRPPHEPKPLHRARERIEQFWMVLRQNGDRPKRLHLTLESAQREGQRIVDLHPGSSAKVWIIECRTVGELAASGPPAADGSPPTTPAPDASMPTAPGESAP